MQICMYGSMISRLDLFVICDSSHELMIRVTCAGADWNPAPRAWARARRHACATCAEQKRTAGAHSTTICTCKLTVSVLVSNMNSYWLETLDLVI